MPMSACFAVAAIFTPPDAFSMLCLAVPLVALYEVSVVSVMLIERGRRKAEAVNTGTDVTP